MSKSFSSVLVGSLVIGVVAGYVVGVIKKNNKKNEFFKKVDQKFEELKKTVDDL